MRAIITYKTLSCNICGKTSFVSDAFCFSSFIWWPEGQWCCANLDLVRAYAIKREKHLFESSNSAIKYIVSLSNIVQNIEEEAAQLARLFVQTYVECQEQGKKTPPHPMTGCRGPACCGRHAPKVSVDGQGNKYFYGFLKPKICFQPDPSPMPPSQPSTSLPKDGLFTDEQLLAFFELQK